MKLRSLLSSWICFNIGQGLAAWWVGVRYEGPIFIAFFTFWFALTIYLFQEKP